jgi:hypothetical protein
MRVFDDRQRLCHFEKQCIGCYIAHYLRTHALHKAVAVDGGSTNFCVLEAIIRDAKDGRPTVSHVLTNHFDGIYLAHDLPDGAVPQWRCTGGVLRASRATFVEGADDAVKDCRCWTAVVGVNGFEPPWIFTNTRREHPIKLAMIKEARNVVFPIDSSKWGAPAVERLSTLHEIADRGKRIVLVTCYPVKYRGEPNRAFEDRVSSFPDAVGELIQLWPPDRLKVTTAPASIGMIQFKETEQQIGAGLADDLNKVHTEAISSRDQDQQGLIIRFDLWAHPL